jgi:hypothetical protein
LFTTVNSVTEGWLSSTYRAARMALSEAFGAELVPPAPQAVKATSATKANERRSMVAGPILAGDEER